MNELLADLWLPLESFNPSMFELLDIFKIGFFFYLTDLGPQPRLNREMLSCQMDHHMYLCEGQTLIS